MLKTSIDLTLSRVEYFETSWKNRDEGLLNGFYKKGMRLAFNEIVYKYKKPLNNAIEK